MKTKENKRDVAAATEINTIRCCGILKRPVGAIHKMTDMRKWVRVCERVAVDVGVGVGVCVGVRERVWVGEHERKETYQEEAYRLRRRVGTGAGRER
jgi:hypothetical protein